MSSTWLGRNQAHGVRGSWSWPLGWSFSAVFCLVESTLSCFFFLPPSSLCCCCCCFLIIPKSLEWSPCRVAALRFSRKPIAMVRHKPKDPGIRILESECAGWKTQLHMLLPMGSWTSCLPSVFTQGSWVVWRTEAMLGSTLAQCLTLERHSKLVALPFLCHYWPLTLNQTQSFAQ